MKISFGMKRTTNIDFCLSLNMVDNQHPKFYTIVLVVTHISLQILYRIVIARAASTMLVSCVYNICFHQSYIALTLAIYDYHLNGGKTFEIYK